MRMLDPLRRAARRGSILFNRWRGYGVSTLGIRVPLQSAVLSPVMEHHLAGGQNQALEVAAALAITLPGDTILELGAGLGVVSAAVRKHTLASRIVAFEPNPDLLQFIPLTHKLNGVTGVEVRHGVVKSDPKSPTVCFYQHRDVWMSSLLNTHPELMRKLEVPAYRLQELLDEIRPQILLMDIEGGELELMEGARNLGSVRSIAIELHEAIYGADGAQRLFENFARLGFAPHPDLSHHGQFVLNRVG